ncbi:unnamed protein product [Closterium sp. Yama58-4]|nr:unnamed protein product [Closterium sp. Yama58-4]
MAVAEDRSNPRHNWWSSFKSFWTSNDLTSSADDGDTPREARLAEDGAEGGRGEGGEGGEGEGRKKGEGEEDEGEGGEGEEGQSGEEEYAGEEEEQGENGDAEVDAEGEWDEGGESDDEGEWDEEGEDDGEGEWGTDGLGGMSAEELEGLWRAGDDAAEGEGEGEGEEGGAEGWTLSEEADDVAEAAEDEAEGSARREGSGEHRTDRSGSNDGSDEADVTTMSVAQTQWTSDLALNEPEFEDDGSLKAPRRLPQRSLIAVANAVNGGRGVVTRATPKSKPSSGKKHKFPSSAGKKRSGSSGARSSSAKKLRKQFRARFKRGSLQLLNLLWSIAVKVNNTKQFGSLRKIVSAVITTGVIIAAEALGLNIPEGRAFIATLVVVARSNATGGNGSASAGAASGNSSSLPVRTSAQIVLYFVFFRVVFLFGTFSARLYPSARFLC